MRARQGPRLAAARRIFEQESELTSQSGRGDQLSSDLEAARAAADHAQHMLDHASGSLADARDAVAVTEQPAGPILWRSQFFRSDGRRSCRLAPAPRMGQSVGLMKLPPFGFMAGALLVAVLGQRSALAEDYYAGPPGMHTLAIGDSAPDFSLLGIDGKTYDACLADEALKKKILSRAQDADQRYKVNSTPTFILKSKAYPGEMSYDAFKKLIDEALGQS